MTRNIWTHGLLILLAGAAALGCHRSAVQQKPPADPLVRCTPGSVSVKVAGNKPVEDRSLAGNAATAQMYPMPPSSPDSATPAVRTVPLQAYKD